MAKTKAKVTSVKKALKSNRKKKFSLKNLEFKNNWKKLSYLGLAGFLAFSSISYGAYKKISQEDASALQGSFGSLYISPGQTFNLYGCQVYRANPAWGKVFAYNKTSKKVSLYVAGVFVEIINPYSVSREYRVDLTNIVRMTDGKYTLTVYGSKVYDLRYC